MSPRRIKRSIDCDYAPRSRRLRSRYPLRLPTFVRYKLERLFKHLKRPRSWVIGRHVNHRPGRGPIIAALYRERAASLRAQVGEGM